MRVFLVEGQKKVRSALRLLLEHEDGLEVVGEADGVETIVIKMKDTNPEIVLIGWDWPVEQAESLIRSLHSVYPKMKVVGLGGTPDARQVALGAGVDAFISKWDPPAQLLATLHEIRAEGERKGQER